MCFGHDDLLAEPLWWPASLLVSHRNNLVRYNLSVIAHVTGGTRIGRRRADFVAIRAIANRWTIANTHAHRYTHSRSQ
jgi:hypothetical protein